MLDPYEIRKEFPYLNRRIRGKPIIYLDNAATTHKPISVINAIVEFYSRYNANIHRGIHELAREATEAYEDSREEVSKFIDANRPEEVVFTSGATESLNMIAYGWALSHLEPGDEILTTVMEHHSNLLPWRRVARITNAKIKYVNIKDNGTLNYEEIDSLITERTRIIAITHVSNVLGTINDVRSIARMAHRVGALVVLDGAQSVPHMPVSVKELEVDFLAFSGHKMLGPTGIGVLWGRYDLLEEMEPVKLGGGIVKRVTLEKEEFEDIPWRLEGGTPNIAGAIGLREAIRFLKKIGMNNVRAHEKSLTDYALKRLLEIDKIEIYGPLKIEERGGVIAFNITDMNPLSVAKALSRRAIMVRAGLHCAHILHEHLGLRGTVRASFYIYNTRDEIDVLSETLNLIIELSEEIRSTKNEGCPTG